MTRLDWKSVPGGELAEGTDWVYLIAKDERIVVLTRWEPRRDDHHELSWPPSDAEVARQAALHAIQLGGAYGSFPDAATAVSSHLKQAAQAYESGLDVTGYPAWRHGYEPG